MSQVILENLAFVGRRGQNRVMATPRTAPALGLQLYERLRADVVQGRFPPNAPLRVSALAEQYGTSMSSVREALVRLAEQHLAVLTPNAGFRTAAVSPSDLADLTELRVLVECRALERSIEHGDLVWESGVVAAHHVLERTPARHEGEPGSTDEWAVAHSAFHDALVAACGSPRLVALTRTLRDAGELYRQLSDSDRAGHARDVAGEHRRLTELAVARRGAEAAEALEAHLRLTARLLLDGALDEREGAA